MAINKKLIHFNKKQSFEEQLANNNLLDTSIVFIKDSKEIWTHGQLYNCSSKDITSTDIIDALGYTPLSTEGGTMTGAITLKSEQYTGNYGMDASNSNIINVNAIFTSDLADGATEGIQFARTNGNYDSLWAADGVLYFSPNGNNPEHTGSYDVNNTIYHSGNFNPADYLPLSGGTINGTTTDPIIVNTSASSVGVRLQINKVNKAYVGYGSSVGAYLYNYDTSAYIGVDTSGTPYYNNGTIKTTLIHSGNIGSYNAGSATKLQTARTIWGQSFDGTADIEGNIDKCNWIRYYTGSANSGYIVGRGEEITGGNGLGLWTYGNTPIFFGTSSARRMLINSSGNVTIGASDLAGTTYKMSVDGKVHIRATTGAAMTEGAGSLIVGNEAVLMIDANNIQAKTDGTTAGPLYINDWGGNVLLCGKNNGNVGIGVNNPSAKLHVNYDNTSNPISGAIGVHINRQGFDSNNETGAAFAITTGSKGAVIYGGNLGFALNYYNGSAHTRLITGLPSGNVGIGTENPVHKLDVQGGDINTSSYMHAMAYKTSGDYGIWKGSVYTSALSAADLVLYGTKIYCDGAVAMSSTLSVGGSIMPSSNNELTLGTYGTASFGFVHANVHSSGASNNNLWLVAGSSIDEIGIQFARNNNGTSTEKIGSWDGKGLYPATDKVTNLGLLTSRWANVYSQYGNFSSDVTIGDAMLLRYSTTNPYLQFAHGGYNWYIQAYNSNYLYLGAGSTNSVRIKYNGELYTPNNLVVSGNTTISGDLAVEGDATASGFFQSSDERLKDFVEDITIDFDVLKSIPKKYFTWKNDLEKKLNIGTGAQTVQKYYPELVNDNNGTLTVAYDKMSMLALKAVDVLYEENVNLKNECSELKNECSELKYRLDELENFLNGIIYGN